MLADATMGMNFVNSPWMPGGVVELQRVAREAGGPGTGAVQ